MRDALIDRPARLVSALPLFRSKKDAVLGALRASIIEGALKPGQRLVIDDLAEQYGVSPIPVREALQQLQADGLVTIQPHMGATVTRIEQGLVAEIFGLLESLETLSAKRASELMTKADVAHMEQLLREMDGRLDDLDAWSELNVRLHVFICDCANMPLVKSMLIKVLDHWNRLRKVHLADVHSKRAQVSHQEHWQMWRAMKACDLPRLERIILQHNGRARDAYTEQLNRSLAEALTE